MLKIDSLNITFNKGLATERNALQNISLTAEDSDFITVIGSNGAGKSTLLNVIAGVFYPDSGSVELDGVDLTFLPEHKRAKNVSRVVQDPLMGTAGGMNIEENLALAFRRGKKRGLSWGISKQEREFYYEKLKSLDLGLEKVMSQKVNTLSGGQRQSLSLLMAVLQEPRLLLLDEHTAALDPKTAARVLELTKEVTKSRKFTTIMVTHNMADAIKMGNRLIMMDNGKIIYDVSGEEKLNLKISDLLQKFEESGAQLSDRVLLTKTEQK